MFRTEANDTVTILTFKSLNRVTQAITYIAIYIVNL